jgi:hypothetical protein
MIIKSVRDKSINSYIFNMSGENSFEYINESIRVLNSGELLNKETNFVNLNNPIRVIFIHRGFSNFSNSNIAYIPFMLNCSGANGISKITAIYQATGNNLGNVSWGVIPTGGTSIGPEFKIENYGTLFQNDNIIVDQWFYSGNNTLGEIGSSFIKNNDNKILINTDPINNNVISLEQPGSTIGISGILTPNYSYNLIELLVINRNATNEEELLIFNRLCTDYNVCPESSLSSVPPNLDFDVAAGSAAGGAGSGDPIWNLFVRIIDINSVQRDANGRILFFKTSLYTKKYLDTKTYSNFNLLSYGSSNFSIVTEKVSALPGVITEININGGNYNNEAFDTFNGFIRCVGCWTPRVNGYQILFKIGNLQNSDSFSGVISSLYEEATGSIPGGSISNLIKYYHNMLSLVGLNPGNIDLNVPILDTNNTNAKWELAPNFICEGCDQKDPIAAFNPEYPCEREWECEPCDITCPNYDENEVDMSEYGQAEVCCNFGLESTRVARYLCECYNGQEVSEDECEESSEGPLEILAINDIIDYLDTLLKSK